MAHPAAPTNSWVTADRMSPGLLTANQFDDSEDFRTGVMADEVDPGSLLNSACYRFADFIFAISARARSAPSA